MTMKTGWIRSIRTLKSMVFISATDGHSEYQLTIKDGVIDGELKIGASFVAEGEDSVTPRGQYEFLVSKIKVVGKSDDTYPIQPKRHTSEFLRTIPELRGRVKSIQDTWKVRHHLTQAIHRFMDDEDFYQYHTPLIVDSDCEGAGDTFKVSSDWLDQELTVSGQLHGEVGMMSLGKIYTFGPCFRAEKSATRKHLSEFWMVEPEMMFFDLDQTIDFSERFVKYIIKYCSDKMGLTHDIVDKEWIRVTYQEICDKFGISWGEDISSELEKKIVMYYDSPVYVTHWPKELKPFYMKKDDKVAYCFDLIFPEVGELIGGSVREEDYDKLVSQMEGMDLEKMDWYLKTREYGTVPHSGFGLGFERMLMYICGVEKIHDVIPFPVSY
jgi:asparaginyl-tRNA synthetase